MKIHAHVLCYNEEKMLPFFLDYYSQFCEKIFVYDNISTDNSVDIAGRFKKVPVQIFQFDSEGELRDDYHISLKQNMYKQYSRDADWVMVLDMDEFVYHPNLLEKLQEYKEAGVTYPRIKGYQMVSQEFPDASKGLITEQVKTGFQDNDFSKCIVFNPTIDVLFGPGCHPDPARINEMSLQEKFKMSEEAEIQLLHYAYLSEDDVASKCKNRAQRRGEYSKMYGFGMHYEKTDEDARQWHKDLLERSEEVIK